MTRPWTNAGNGSRGILRRWRRRWWSRDGAFARLHPSLALEEKDLPRGDSGHHQQTGEIAEPSLQLRHELEVHAIHAGDKGERDEDRADDGEDAHDLVGPLGDGAEIEFEQAGGEFAIAFDHVH